MRESGTVISSVRSAGGRSYLWRNGGWIDSETLDPASPSYLAGPKVKQLKVKYLSAAYFALLKTRPDLKAGLALGDRVVLVIAKGKVVTIAGDGEESADKVTAFLK